MGLKGLMRVNKTLLVLDIDIQIELERWIWYDFGYPSPSLGKTTAIHFIM